MIHKREMGVVIQVRESPKRTNAKSISLTIHGEEVDTAIAKIKHLYESIEEDREINIKYFKNEKTTN